MKQRDVNLYVAEVINNHLGRLNSIKFQDIEAIIVQIVAECDFKNYVQLSTSKKTKSHLKLRDIYLNNQVQSSFTQKKGIKN